MNDRPTPLELILIANQTLQTAVLPGAPPEQLYPLRMIANALGIAARELEASNQDVADETRGLNLIYSDTRIADDHFTGLNARNRQFAQDIRRGAFEGDTSREAQVQQHLVVTARRKLTAANPKGLQENSHKSFKNK